MRRPQRAGSPPFVLSVAPILEAGFASGPPSCQNDNALDHVLLAPGVAVRARMALFFVEAGAFTWFTANAFAPSLYVALGFQV